MNWSGKGINIDGEYLHNLSFADDNILNDNIPDLQDMIPDLNNNSKNVGHTMNTAKTKVMTNTHININIHLEGKQLDKVNSSLWTLSS